jgi:hypothetical protein
MAFLDPKQDSTFKHKLPYHPDVKITYSLCFLEGTMYPNKQEWFHPFRISYENFEDDKLDGIEWFFFELGKWRKLGNFSITSRRDVWLSFLSNPEMLDTMLTTEYENEYKEARRALRLIDKAKYTPEQLWAMERNADELYFAWEALKMDIDEATKEGEANAENRILAILQDLKSGMSDIDIAKKHQVEVSFVEKFK